MFRSKAIVGLAAGVLVSLATPSAWADGAAPAATAGQGHLSESAVSVESAGELTDSTNVGALAAGLGLLGMGGLSMVGGGVAYVTLSAQTTDGCEASATACVDEHKAGKSAGILAMVLGGAAVAVGIPIVIGSTDSSGTGKHKQGAAGGSAVLAPELRVSVGAASLTWSF